MAKRHGPVAVAITGDVELDAVLREIASEHGAKSINRVARAAIKAVVKEIVLPKAKELVPVDSGFLEDELKITAMRRKKNRIGFSVGFRDPLFRGDTFYAGFIEFGWEHRLGFTVKADSFLRRALYGEADRIFAEVRRRMRDWVIELNRATVIGRMESST